MSFRTVTGAHLQLLPGASDSLSGFWYEQLPDFEELVFSLHLLRKEDLFVDVGANQGGWSLTMAGHGARVISFEPVPVTRERLLANLALNPSAISERIQVFPVGLSDRREQVSFTADLDAANHQIRNHVEAGRKIISVNLERADDVLRDENPNLIKIDVEGEELGVLKGARGILSKPSLRAVVMETFRPFNHAAPVLIAAEAILKENDFLPMAYDPRKRDLRPLLHPSDGGQNTLYIRDSSAVLARLKQAPPLHVIGTRL